MRRSQADPLLGGRGRVLLKKGVGVGEGGFWNPKAQKILYQKSPKSIFPFVNFTFSHNEIRVRGGGGGG